MSSKIVRGVIFFALLAAFTSSGYGEVLAQAQYPSDTTGTLAATTVLYTQSPDTSGALLQSSRNGSDYDKYVWDDFTLSSAQPVTEIQWRGGFDPAKFGSGGPVVYFTVSIYASIPGGTQPDVIAHPLVQYQTVGNAGQTSAGSFNGTVLYDYAFVLPAAFQATAGTTYWVQIEAYQTGIVPDWGITTGTGGNGQYFRMYTGVVGDIHYDLVQGDTAFTLLTSTPSLTVSSLGAGDGWVLESAQGSGVGGSFNATATSFRLGDDDTNRQYRTILSFNTAKLPDNAKILSAVLMIRQVGVPVGTNPFLSLGNLQVDIRKGSFGGAAALAATDFQAAASAANVAVFSSTSVNGWYSATLNLAGRNNINKTGVTQFRLRFATPSDNDNIADYLRFVSGNSTINKPVLVVTYSVP